MWIKKTSSADRHFNAHLNRHAPMVYASSKTLQTILGLSEPPAPFTPPLPSPTRAEALQEQQESFGVQTFDNLKNENPCSLHVKLPSREAEDGNGYSSSTEKETAASSSVMLRRRWPTDTAKSEEEINMEHDCVARRFSRRGMRLASPNNRPIINQINGGDLETHSLSLPTITITTPAGGKRSCPSPSTETPIPPPAKKQRHEKASPITPGSLRCSPASSFQHYSFSLMSSLIGWCSAIENSHLFWHYAPPPNPPCNLLISYISLWCIEMVPPRELMKLEPSDIETIRWNEVDTLSNTSGSGVSNSPHPLLRSF
ncbi:hypothetical protein AOQ84DRAFT_159435 [Glonium stellatum]|uniref:Uncharacterized protein n=1 Tax=Glonium stellatum TaxID=574774 RepID=A0A8E2F8C2_9PEZI|nr:hypothetical protein AOQ84DRAFT_159435 [Glonium stellatum]